MRHTAAHVMAQAVLELYPQAKIGIGPPVDDGFYYDFDLGRDEEGNAITFSQEDLPRIERRMRQIIVGRHPLVCREVSAEEARRLFRDQPYKLELIGELAEDGQTISTYRHDTFEDLCRGPHVAHTGQIVPDGLKLMSIAAAYWRGDEENTMLQRLYGTAWPSKDEVQAYLERLEEARQRDHRRLGRELQLFAFDEEVGPGLALWLPNGEIVVEELEKLAREVEDAAGYQRVRTPHIAKEELYLRSRHLPYYEEDMYPAMERGGVRYFLRPMNCPFHHKIYASAGRSYRDLPLRLAEYGMVYRYEQSGELFGLMRVRAAQQNDAHIYCSKEQFDEEFMAVLDMYRYYFDLFGIEKYVLRLSKHGKEGLGKKYVDDVEAWLETEEMVRRVMQKSGMPFVEADDEAAFYGPKIDVQVWSAIGREFSIATNQVDFAGPSRFDLTFTNSAGEEETPLCIHRAPLGSHERFIGFLIEHYAGNFPVWLAPEQVRIIPITDEHHAYAKELQQRLRQAGVRASADLSSDRMQAKIRQAQLMKVPYMAIAGDRELQNKTIALRRRDGKRQNGLGVEAFVNMVREKVAMREAGL
jgi:threonyl-tRNA synthetase